MSHVFSGDYTRISAPRWHESPGALCHPLPSASGDITRQGFRVTLGLIFWYVTLEAMWYMYNITYFVWSMPGSREEDFCRNNTFSLYEL